MSLPEQKHTRGRPPGGRLVWIHGGVSSGGPLAAKKWAYPKEVEGETRWFAGAEDVTDLVLEKYPDLRPKDPGNNEGKVPSKWFPGKNVTPPAELPLPHKDPPPLTVVTLTDEQRAAIVDEVLEEVEGERLRIYGNLAQEIHDLKEILKGLLIQCKNTLKSLETREYELRDVARRAEETRTREKNLLKSGVFRPEGRNKT